MSRTDTLLQGLNPPQQEAVRHKDGPLLVIAGAGTGKTKTAIHRLAWLLAGGIPPEALLCITFTNKAAREMQERATALVGPLAKQVLIRTFYSAAAVLLREYLPRYPKAGRTASFTIADQDAQLTLIREAIAERNFDLKANKAETFLWRISRYKNELAEPDALLSRSPTNPLMDWEKVLGLIKESDRYVNRLTAEIWIKYEEKLRKNNLLDFDDLILLFVRMLLDEPVIRKELQERFRYIQVDEFQDTNVAQLQMVKLLAGERQNVMAVGDDYQSLYSWRSADIRCILEFERHFGGARVVKLEQNYRSTPTILKAANKLIALNEAQLPKQLFTMLDAGSPVVHQEVESIVVEAEFAAQTIAESVAKGRRYSDFALLFRVSALSVPFEEKFRAEGIPYQVTGGPGFFDRREVQDCFAYYKLLANPRDSLSLERVLNAPRRGLGERGYQKVLAIAGQRDVDLLTALEYAVAEAVLTDKAAAGAAELAAIFRQATHALERKEPLGDVANRLIGNSGLLATLVDQDRKKAESRADVVRTLLAGLGDYEREHPRITLADYLERVALADGREEKNDGDAVRLMTIHASKGLEFPVVFVVGMEQEILPNRRAMDEGNLPEERRLAYVAITRAREQLFLTNVRIRWERGGPVVMAPSQFLEEAL